MSVKIADIVFPVSQRDKIPDAIAVALLVANHHRCCICNERNKHVQIHHIDGDNSNHNPSNLAVVCMDCHSRVTGDEGLGRRYSPAEVREYKRRWELECSGKNTEDEDEDEDEDSSDEEPVDTIYRSPRVRSHDHYHRNVEMERGQEFIASITADDYINVAVCSILQYEIWLNSGKLTGYDGDDEVRECELSFVAPYDGTYALVLINDGDEDVDATIDAAIWEADEED